MANNYRYAHEWRPWTDADLSTEDTFDFDAAANFEPGDPIGIKRSATNRPSGVQEAVVQTFDHAGGVGGSAAGVYQVVVYKATHQARMRGGTEGSYSWGSWEDSGAQWAWAASDSLEDIESGEPRVLTFAELANSDADIPAPAGITGVATTDTVLVVPVADDEKFMAYVANRPSGGTDHLYTNEMYYQAVAPSSPAGFGVRDIVAVGFEDASAEVDWLGAGTNSVAKVHYVAGGLSLGADDEATDGFSYGKIFESRILQEQAPEMTLNCYLTDSDDKPPDNMSEGKVQLVEIGLKNSAGERLLFQGWEARLVGVERTAPEAEFAFQTYRYRMANFRLEVPSAAQVIANF